MEFSRKMRYVDHIEVMTAFQFKQVVSMVHALTFFFRPDITESDSSTSLAFNSPRVLEKPQPWCFRNFHLNFESFVQKGPVNAL